MGPGQLLSMERAETKRLRAQLAEALAALRDLHDTCGEPDSHRDAAAYAEARARAARVLKEGGA